MKLHIKRDQKPQTGLLGGHKGMAFLLSYRIELTPDEEALVEKYKVGDSPLTYRTDRQGKQVQGDTISSLLRGSTDEHKDITVLLNNEEILKEACENFKVLLDVMATFGGEEVVDFD